MGLLNHSFIETILCNLPLLQTWQEYTSMSSNFKTHQTIVDLGLVPSILQISISSYISGGNNYYTFVKDSCKTQIKAWIRSILYISLSSFVCVQYVVLAGLIIYSYSSYFHEFLPKSSCYTEIVYNSTFHAPSIVPFLPLFLLL